MTTVEASPPALASDRSSILFTSVIGVVSVLVLLQGVLAGVFLEHDGKRDADSGWIDAHAWGAHLATALTVGAAVLAVVKLRDVKPVLYGSIALAVAVLLESYLGGLIRDDSKDVLTIVHVPLAMAVMGLSVWLSVTAAKLRRAGA